MSFDSIYLLGAELGWGRGGVGKGERRGGVKGENFLTFPKEMWRRRLHNMVKLEG